MVDKQSRDCVARQTIPLRKCLEAPLRTAGKPARRPDPERAVGSRGQHVYRIGGQVSLVFAERDELISVEARQPFIGTHPQKTIGGLGNGSNRVLRQSLLLRPDRQGILRERLPGVQGEDVDPASGEHG